MIVINLKGVPPTTNHAYANRRGGYGRILTKEGERYKNETIEAISKQVNVATLGYREGERYGLVIQVWLTKEQLRYKEKKGEIVRYKNIDASNRVKLLEDALAQALGIDDCHNFLVLVEKKEGAAEATTVYFWDLKERIALVFAENGLQACAAYP